LKITFPLCSPLALQERPASISQRVFIKILADIFSYVRLVKGVSLPIHPPQYPFLQIMLRYQLFLDSNNPALYIIIFIPELRH